MLAFSDCRLELLQCMPRTTHLGVGAHADDLEFMAYHGIEACYKREDAWFSGIVVTDGGGCLRGPMTAGLSEQELIAMREAEQEEAAILGQYNAVIQLGLNSQGVKDRSTCLVEELARWFSHAQPRVLYLHNIADSHETHVSVALQSIEALRQLPQACRPQQVWGCEVWRDLDWLAPEDKHCLSVGEYPALAEDLCKVFRSQIDGGKNYAEAVLARRLANATWQQSHQKDAALPAILAMDYRPLLENPYEPVEAYAEALLDRFAADVRSRLRRCSRK